MYVLIITEAKNPTHENGQQELTVFLGEKRSHSDRVSNSTSRFEAYTLWAFILN